MAKPTHTDVHFWIMAVGDCRMNGETLTDDEIKALKQSHELHIAHVDFTGGSAYASQEALVQHAVKSVESLFVRLSFQRMSSVTRLLSKEDGEKFSFPDRNPSPIDPLNTNDALAAFYFDRAMTAFAKIADAVSKGAHSLMLTDPVIIHLLYTSLCRTEGELLKNGDILHLLHGYRGAERGVIEAELLRAPSLLMRTKR